MREVRVVMTIAVDDDKLASINRGRSAFGQQTRSAVDEITIVLWDAVRYHEALAVGRAEVQDGEAA